ncbi:MAG: CCA tRNA nucleotidyltransferase [Mariniblastus sp.]|nr:CCA tRNA nucleotidyltransferase [Mariniblastus sp.]
MSPREFAIQVAEKLQAAGFQGLWAGGCVRDQLVGRSPKDYDVATDATPEQVRELFGHRRTIPIGAAFGVITVVGPKSAGQIEVATFRRDMEYSDGRRPDSVEYTDAREDALRRDFTINGIFMDPVQNEVIDYVKGRADIDGRIVRAIGDPHERIREDKLRLLRGVRFAGTFSFELEPLTRAAVIQHAPEIGAVSAERIGGEMRRILVHPNRADTIQLLADCQLLREIVEDGDQLYKNRANWRTRLGWLQQLGPVCQFEQAAAILLSPLLKTQGILPTAERWKLSNAEQKTILWIEKNGLVLSRSHLLPWSELQPLLIHPDIDQTLQITKVQFGDHHPGVRACQKKLALPAEELDPAPLVSGNDLIKLGMQPGPVFAAILDRIRVAQLDGQIETPQEGLQLVKSIQKNEYKEP